MKNGKLLVAPTVLWLCIFFIIPMLIVVAVSFASRTPYGQVVFNWTFSNYQRFAETLYISIFGQTLVVIDRLAAGGEPFGQLARGGDRRRVGLARNGHAVAYVRV